MINQVKIASNIGLSILILGLINLYNIVKAGIIFNIPTNISYTKFEGFKENIIENVLNNISIFRIDINSIKIIIFVSIILYIIFNLDTNTIVKVSESNTIEKRDSLEYKLLIGLGLLGLILMIMSKELIILYLGLELYSFTIYVLILVKESIIIRKISIIYLILSSLASGILLYTFNLIYNKYGLLDLDLISRIISTNNNDNNNILLYLLLIALLFKLGAVPFSYWLIRVYADLDKRIFWYQLTIPKLVFFILLIKFLTVFYISNSPNSEERMFIYILFIVSILSLLVGSIGGLFQSKDNLLLSYSSILNIGFILLSLSLLLINNDLNTFALDNSSYLWILYNFFMVYIFNLIGLFAALLLFYYSSLVFNLRSFYTHPFFFLSFLILIFSFIGIPPFSGFFSKFFLLFTLVFTSNTYSLFSSISILLFLLSTFISAFFYFKFLFSSSSSPITTIENKSNLFMVNSESKDISLSAIVLSFITIITITYPFLLVYFIPLLQEISNLIG